MPADSAGRCEGVGASGDVGAEQDLAAQACGGQFLLLVIDDDVDGAAAWLELDDHYREALRLGLRRPRIGLHWVLPPPQTRRWEREKLMRERRS
jgi:hypothetical protein